MDKEDNIIENSHRFFRNTACMYFPCHKDMGDHEFNCLFCYCPLYFLGEKCGGNFKKIGIDGEVKDCSKCAIPHRAENYDRIVKIVSDNIEQFKENERG